MACSRQLALGPALTGLHGRAAGRAAWLGVEGKERHTLVREAVDVGCRHTAAHAATVGTEITIVGVVHTIRMMLGLGCCAVEYLCVSFRRLRTWSATGAHW